MKKIYSILILSLCILFALPFLNVSTQVFAETAQAKISASNQTVYRGTSFNVPIQISNNLGLQGTILKVSYTNTDNNIQLVGVDNTWFDGQTHSEEYQVCSFVNNYSNGTLIDEQDSSISYIQIVCSTSNSFSDNGTLATLHFTSLLSAPLGDYSINFSAWSVYDNNGHPASLEITSPVITLQKAQFNAVWQDFDGTILKETDYNETQSLETLQPVYGVDFSHSPDSKYSEYNFTGWSIPQTVGNTNIYTAQYNNTPVEYTVFRYVDGEAYDEFACNYDAKPNLSDPEEKTDYTFLGWYTDSSYKTQISSNYTMPDHDINVYGYYKYNVREDNCPTIQLKHIETVNNVAKISVVLSDNAGLYTLKLALDDTCYNTQYLTYDHYEQGASVGFNNDMSLDVLQDNKTFYWSSRTINQNTTATGEILVLYFNIENNTPNGAYSITLNYNKEDITYCLEKSQDKWHSLLNIKETTVSVGTKTYFENEIYGTSIKLIVNSDKEIAYNVYMVIEDVTSQMIEKLGADNITKALGSNMSVGKIYSIYFIQNGERFTPDATMTYTLNLTEAEKLASKLELYKVVDKTITSYSSQVSGGNITFTSDEICEWLIAENKTTGTGGIGNVSFNAMLMIIMLCSDVLAGALIVLAKNYKTKKLNSQGGIK